MEGGHGFVVFWEFFEEFVGEFFVVGVSGEVAALDHFEPSVFVSDEFGYIGFLESVFGTGYFINALVGKVDFDCFPGEFEAIFVALNCAVNFQLVGFFGLERIF